MQQYIVSTAELKEIQKIEKEMLIEIDRMCRKYNLPYNMVGGTMLGAIRHKGFIPWDDDADIAMLRVNYERFVEICKTELDTSRFYFQDIHQTEGYRWGYGKLRRKDTKFIRYGQEDMPYEQGIFVDIFPMDNVPDGKVKGYLHQCKCFILRKKLWSAVGQNVENNLIKRLWYAHWAKIPREKLIKQYDKLVDETRGKETKKVRILTFPAPKGTDGFYKIWYQEQSYYDFEDIQLQGARDYDGWLRYKFGEYMKWPPIEQRKIHPVSKLKLLEVE